MAILCEVAQDRERLHRVIDSKHGRGMAWATSTERKLFGGVFATMMLLKFAPEIACWAVRVYQETGDWPFFDNGFEYRFQRNGREVTRHYGKLKIASMEPGTIENELTARRNGGCYEPVRPGDSRITQTGRVMRPKALDESPQFFNMLVGQLGVVGLRTGRVEFELDILANSDKEPYSTYLKHLRAGVLPGFIPVHVTCPDMRSIPLERRLWLETYYAESMASFTNDRRIVSYFIRHRDEVLR